MGKLSRMMTFKHRKPDAAAPAVSPSTTPTAQPKPSVLVSELVKKMQNQSIGVRQSYTVMKVEGKPMGLGLAMDSAAESGGRAVVYAVRDGSSAMASGIPQHSFLTAINGKDTAGLDLDSIQRMIAEAVKGNTSVILEAAVATDVPPPSAAESIVAAMLAGDGPTEEELAAASAKAAAANAAAVNSAEATAARSPVESAEATAARPPVPTAMAPVPSAGPRRSTSATRHDMLRMIENAARSGVVPAPDTDDEHLSKAFAFATAAAAIPRAALADPHEPASAYLERQAVPTMLAHAVGRVARLQPADAASEIGRALLQISALPPSVSQVHMTTVGDLLADAKSGALAARLSASGIEPAASRTHSFASAARRLIADGGVAPSTRAAAFWVPGRVEVMGKHTDYAGGRSLLCAVSKGFAVVSAERDDALVRVLATFELSGAEDEASVALDPNETSPLPDGWARYPAATARRLARNFGISRGVDLALSCDLPEASGMSSSSAVIILTFLALGMQPALPHPPFLSCPPPLVQPGSPPPGIPLNGPCDRLSRYQRPGTSSSASPPLVPSSQLPRTYATILAASKTARTAARAYRATLGWAHSAAPRITPPSCYARPPSSANTPSAPLGLKRASPSLPASPYSSPSRGQPPKRGPSASATIMTRPSSPGTRPPPPSPTVSSRPLAGSILRR